MQQNPVVPHVVALPRRRPRPQCPRRPPAYALDQRQQAGMIPAVQLVARDPIPVRTVYHHQPALLAQFDRDENRANMVSGGRAYVGCLHLASPLGSSVETQTYRMHAYRPMESTTPTAGSLPGPPPRTTNAHRV